MSFFSRSSGKKHYGDKHQGRSYYKREGFFGKLIRMFGSLSNSGRKYNNHHSHNSHHNHYSDQGHHQRRRYKSSWS